MAIVKETLEIIMRKDVTCKAGASVIQLSKEAAETEVIPAKLIVGKEMKQGKWPVYLEEISNDNANLVAKIIEVKCQDDVLDDIDIQALTAEETSYRVVLKGPQSTVMKGELQVLKDEASANKKSDVGLSKDLQEVIRGIVEQGIVSEDEIKKRVSYMQDNHIFISYQLLYQIIGGIANSIEDGRIERIRSNRFPGFEKLRIYHRGKFWTTQKREYRTYEDIKNSPPDILMAITDQILSLATCQLYSGGFVTTYANTPVMDIVKDLMPNISRGIMAGRTRDMAVEVIEIAKKLAPYIYETCKLSKEDIRARTVLEKILADMIKGMFDQTPNTGLTENEEDTDTGSANSTFPTSDLEITVDDETYDKLVEKSQQSDDGSGLIIKRKHPKKQSEDGSDKESNENSNDKSRDSKEDPSGTPAAKDGKNPDNSGKSMPGESERGKEERAKDESKDESKDGTEKKDGNQQDEGAEDPRKSAPSDKGIKKGEKVHGKNTEQGYDEDSVYIYLSIILAQCLVPNVLKLVRQQP